MRLHRILIAALLSLFTVSSALADEIYIYSGRIKHEDYTGSTFVSDTDTFYVLLDYSASTFAFLYIDPKTKTYTSHTGSLTSWATYPYSPQIDSHTRTFIYADEVQAGDFVTVTRLRSNAGPALQAISSTVSKRLPRSLTFSHSFRLSTALVTELNGLVGYHKLLTTESNDGLNDLGDSLQLVVAYAQKKKQIN